MTERQLWYLPKKTQIESIQSRRLALSLAIIICGILAAFIIWAYFVRIQELSLAVGEITPVNRISVVEHLEGGLVYQILVDEGSQVKKGNRWQRSMKRWQRSMKRWQKLNYNNWKQNA